MRLSPVALRAIGGVGRRPTLRREVTASEILFTLNQGFEALLGRLQILEELAIGASPVTPSTADLVGSLKKGLLNRVCVGLIVKVECGGS